MTPAFDVADLEVRARRRIATRLLPLAFLLCVVAYIDATAIFFLLCSLSAPADSQAASQKVWRSIADVQLGAPIFYDYRGDSWDPTWAQDDRLYAAVNDGAGLGTVRRNIAFNQISGSDPLTLTGQLQNLMDDYGEINAPVASDGRNWKSGGTISIDGVLYMSVGMDRYVYATSNNGFWDNGDNYILGRVLRSKIGALKAADWTFYQGGDGMLDSSILIE